MGVEHGVLQVGRIGLDYKKTLGAFKDLRALEDQTEAADTGRSQEYADALSACHLRSADKLLKLCQVRSSLRTITCALL